MYIFIYIYIYICVYIYIYVCIYIYVYVKDGRGAGGNRQQSLLYMKNKTRPCNNNTGVTTYINIHTYSIQHRDTFTINQSKHLKTDVNIH